MIFSLLYSSSLLKNNEHRNIYLYVIGSLIYVVLHGLLFSSIGSNVDFIRKYRVALYVIAASDILYVHKKYKEFKAEIAKQAPQNPQPVIEEVKENVMECHGEQCCIRKSLPATTPTTPTAPKPEEPVVKKEADNESSATIPIYHSEKIPSEDKTKKEEIPVYHSKEDDKEIIPATK